MTRARERTAAAGRALTSVRARLTALYGGMFVVAGAALLTVTYALVAHTTGGTGRPLRVEVGTAAPTGAASPAAVVAADGAVRTLSPKDAAAMANQLEVAVAQQHQHLLDQLLQQSGIALAIMTVVAVVLGWLVAGRVLRPLRTITEVTRSISATNLHERLALGGHDELTRLGDTIDALLDRLEGAFDAQRHFVAHASHELRTPVTVVRAVLQLAVTDPDASVETFRRAAAEALAENDRQEQLIEALLVLARSERGLDRREPVELARVVEDVTAARGGAARRDGLRLDVRTRAASVAGDPRLVERLVANLVDNALRHNVPGGRVDVRVAPVGSGGGGVVVENTGPVVTPAELDGVFEPFVRLGEEQGEAEPGLGLGLSIVRAIARAHDATLDAAPREGGGLRIGVTFSAAGPDSAPVRAPARMHDEGVETFEF